MTKKIILAMSTFLLTAGGYQLLQPIRTPPGLTAQHGVLLKDGQPYRGIGANYFSLFSRLIKDPDDTASLTNLAALARARIPFVRFMCTGFWPVDQQLYLTNRTEYFARLDRVVRCAETNGIGLIPSLFWQLAMVPDIVGEPVNELGNPQSKTIAFIRRYTAEVVTRYKDSPAIWGWEFGNEYNLACDLPNPAQHRPMVALRQGTPAYRTTHDELTFSAVGVAFAAFTETVRRFDRTRFITTGNAVPRPAAWHNLHEKTWKADTAAQFGEMLLRDNPDPFNTICIHLYPNQKHRYSGGTTNYQAAVALAQHYAQQADKPLFIGEFGVSTDQLPAEQHRVMFAEMLEAIAREHVSLAAFWVFDLANQHDCTITFTNQRAWMLDLVQQANVKLQKENK